MVKEIIEVFRCDKCGDSGDRYSITFPTNETLLLDLCKRHGEELERFRDVPGEWIQAKGSKKRFQKSSLEDIRLAIEQQQEIAK